MKTTTSTTNRRKAISPLAFLLTSALLIAPICAQATPSPQNDNKPSQLQENKQPMTDREMESAEKEQRIASLPKLQPLLAKITDDMALTILEGLPHPFYNPDQLAAELKAKKTVTQHGFAFYQQAITPNAEDKKNLAALLRNPDSFKPHKPGKLCGGFHPDFTLSWDINGTPLEVQVCFGCQEIRAYHGEEKVYADIAEHAAALRPLLETYHKQCPKPENEG